MMKTFIAGALRLVGATAASAALSAPIGAAAVLDVREIGATNFAEATVVGMMPIYFVLTLGFGWPVVWVLRRFNRLSAWTVGGCGACVGTLGGLGVHNLLQESYWTVVLGSLSGFVAGAILGRFTISEVFTRERAADLYALESNGAQRYRAFFSYARADEATANWLWKQLDTYVTPKDLTNTRGSAQPLPRRLHPIFRDRVDLSAGGEVSSRLATALAASDHLIVLCSPRSAKSEWVEYEVKTFVDAGRVQRILPVIADGEPESGDESSECFPPSLRGKRILAADLRYVRGSRGRWIGDGRPDGALKLIAALLGIEFDALVRRERRRQQQRAAAYMAATGLTGALAVITMVFAFAAIESFSWSLANVDRAVAAEFGYLAGLYEREGVAATQEYLRVKTSSPDGRLVCLVLMDGNGAVIGGDTDIVFPVPRQPGPLQRFTSETTLTALYEGQRFAVRSDGIVQRMSPAHVVGAASCNLRPPLLYGVFRAMVTPPPQIKATGEREQKPFALSLPLSQNR